MTLWRVATYNVHKCRGMDWRISPARTMNVLHQLQADVIAVQEIFEEQARLFANRLAFDYTFAPARILDGKQYGNAVFSRREPAFHAIYDLSVPGREPRNCVRVDLPLDRDKIVQVFTVHLGTSFFERRKQAQKLLSKEVLSSDSLGGPRLVMGDFNEWTRGLVTRSLSHALQSADLQEHLGRGKTYPGIAPVLHLDHIYYEQPLHLHRLRLHRSFEALLASDHLPLVAEFRLAM